MKFKKQTIAFEDTNYFSKIAIDYIHKKEKLQPFIQAFPDKESLAKQIFLKQQQQIDRVLLQRFPWMKPFRKMSPYYQTQTHLPFALLINHVFLQGLCILFIK